MWSKQIETENSSHSDSLPPSLIYALDPGDPESSGTLRATCLHCGELWRLNQVWQVQPGADSNF